MRTVIDKYLYNSDSILIVADFGKFPLMETTNRYINVQLSESLMTNIAIGLASSGKRVFIYSAAGFTLYRAFDTIKHNIVENSFKGNITFLNAGEGFIYNFGLTHMLIDDLNILSDSFYNFKVFMPYDEYSTNKALNDSYGITYIRLCPDNSNIFEYKINNYKKVYCIGWLLNRVKKLVEKDALKVDVVPFYNLNEDISADSMLIVDSLYLNKFHIPQLCLNKNDLLYFIGSYKNRVDKFGFSDDRIVEFIKKNI